jgi:hypothetical protein
MVPFIVFVEMASISVLFCWYIFELNITHCAHGWLSTKKITTFPDFMAWSAIHLVHPPNPSHGPLPWPASKQEEFEDTKGTIRNRISKKNRQHNGQKKKYKKTSNDRQNIHIKLKIERHKPHENPGELRCSGRVSSSCSTSGTCRVKKKLNKDSCNTYFFSGSLFWLWDEMSCSSQCK